MAAKEKAQGKRGQGAGMTSGDGAGRRTLVGKRAKGCIDLKPPVAWPATHPFLSNSRSVPLPLDRWVKRPKIVAQSE